MTTKTTRKNRSMMVFYSIETTQIKISGQHVFFDIDTAGIPTVSCIIDSIRGYHEDIDDSIVTIYSINMLDSADCDALSPQKIDC